MRSKSRGRWRRLDGDSAVSLVVQKQSGVNTVKVVEDVKARLDLLRAALPADITTEVIRDQSRFIKKSIEEVKFHLLLAAVLVSATILLFIRDWRTTLIATLAIPTSIIPTFMFMRYMGFTLNNITMLGLILAIGIVIDDAVVVHENIFRHMEEDGMDGMSAARKGTREIALAVLATSLSLVVIFVPIAFMGGIVGRFFSSFGLTVAFAVVMSLFVSFTLTPMLCSRFLKLEAAPAGGAHQAKSKSGIFYRLIDGAYGGVLKGAMRHKFLVVVLTAVVIYSTVPIGKAMGISLIPRDDQSEYEISVTTPEGYSLERTSQITAELESRIWKLKGTEHVFTTIGQTEGGRVVKGEGDVTRGTIYVRITDLEKRHAAVPVRGWWDVAGHVRRFFDGRRVRPVRGPARGSQVSGRLSRPAGERQRRLAVPGGRRPQTFQVSLAGPDLSQLAAYGDQLIAELKKAGSIVDLDTTLSLRKPEVQVVIDREAASDLGVPVGTIADTLRVLVGGLPVSKFREGDEQYDVWLRADSGKRSTSQDLYQITFPSPAVGLVKLASLAKLNEDRGPTEIERLSRERIVTVRGQPRRNRAGRGDHASRADLEGDEPAAPVFLRLHRPGQDAGRNRLLLPGRVHLVDHVHVPDPGRPVRELDAADRHPDGAAGHDSVRDAVAGVVPHADGPLCDVRPVHAGGDRQEKRHLAGRRHQPAPGQGRIAARRDHRGQPHAAAADPDDHRDAGRGHGADRAGQRTRRRCPGQHGQGDHRRPDALARAGPAGHAGLLCPARHVRRTSPGASAFAFRSSRRPVCA